MMRVDAYNHILSTYKPQSVKSPKKTNNASAVPRDQVQISSLGQDLAVAKKAVGEASDYREDLVAAMKEKYGEGKNPQVDAGDFASTLLSKYQGVFG